MQDQHPPPQSPSDIHTRSDSQNTQLSYDKRGIIPQLNALTYGDELTWAKRGQTQMFVFLPPIHY